MLMANEIGCDIAEGKAFFLILGYGEEEEAF